jgi:hypothetical protein
LGFEDGNGVTKLHIVVVWEGFPFATFAHHTP